MWVEPAQPKREIKKQWLGFWGNFGAIENIGLSRLNPNLEKKNWLSRLNSNFGKIGRVEPAQPIFLVDYCVCTGSTRLGKVV